jgi:hypothetical protein
LSGASARAIDRDAAGLGTDSTRLDLWAIIPEKPGIARA